MRKSLNCGIVTLHSVAIKKLPSKACYQNHFFAFLPGVKKRAQQSRNRESRESWSPKTKYRPCKFKKRNNDVEQLDERFWIARLKLVIVLMRYIEN